MSPVNIRVLGSAALVSSPALWLGFVTGTLPVDDALTRYLVAVALCWAALNVFGLFFPQQASSEGLSQEQPQAPTTLDPMSDSMSGSVPGTGEPGFGSSPGSGYDPF